MRFGCREAGEKFPENEKKIDRVKSMLL